MSKSDDPERLLAEALRAQAVSTPVTMPPLPAVLTEAADAPKPEAEPAPAVEDDPVDDEAVADKAEEQPEPDTFTKAKAVTLDDALAEPPGRTADTPFTEEMVLRELSSGPMTGELATIRINNAQQHYDTERFSPLENLYGPVGGPGFGLISGTEVGSTVGPPVGEFDHLPPEPVTRAVPTTKMPAQPGQVPGWLILLFALVLGLAGGAVAAVLSML
ncbi:hypothetical protein [Kutzneria buriramensis]|uniref:hypothetical protein n=1 Tax=Kutzneria buriramensis TaxID=1045776 RepID=UPI0011C171E2|nr:hypothetical protein [Kutzneria buriramensis]